MKIQLTRGYNRDIPERQGMKGRANALLLALACLLLPLAASAQLPTPTHGWNMGNTLEPPCGEGCWGGFASQALINSVAANGFNTVRIPCAWDSNSTQGQINPAYMARVTEVVNWCLAANLTVIINCHWDNGWFDNESNFRRFNSTANNKIISIWTQVANNFKNFDNRLLFQFSNEPPVDTAAKTAILTQYYQTFVNTVRGTGSSNTGRWLVLSGPNTASDKTYDWFTLPNDPGTPGRLAVDVHEYSPYQFTIMSNDESWGNMFYFWGAGYLHPTRLDRNPTGAYADYANEGYMVDQYTLMKNKFTSQGVPVLIGEYGMIKRTGYPDLTGWDYDLHLAARTYWFKHIHDTANANGLKPFLWDTPGNGVFDWTTGAVLDADVVRAVTGGAALPRPPGGPGSCTPSQTHVGALVTVVTGNGPNKRGQATITVTDNCGNPVASATVTGSFSGTFTENGRTAVTGANGVATITTTGKSGGSPSVTFCVSNITKSGLTYTPSSNVVTCDSN